MAHGTTKGVPIDIDDTLSANSDLLVPSQKAIKTYVDGQNLSDLNDVSVLSTPSTGDVLTYNAATSVWEAQQSVGSSGAIAYYLNESNTQSPYKEFSSIPISGPDVTVAATVASGATSTIESFQTASGVPGVTNVPAGRWAFYLHFSGTLTDSWSVWVEVYTRTSGGSETLRLTTDTVNTSSLNGTPTMLQTDGVFPAISILTTDRIVVKVRVKNNSVASKTITLHTEGTTYYSIATTTLNPSFTAGSVSAVYGTAPIASSGGSTPTISISQATISTDGYLSLTDWNTFNNKVATTRSISTSSPLSGGGDLSTDRTISIQDAAADGTTKGAATFTASDFDSASGVISIDYTNGQAASSSTKGFLTSADWTSFNGKVATTRSISTSSPLSGGGDLSADRTISIQDADADGSTKGAAAFSANDFNASAGIISLDYVNGQTATSVVNGFLSSTDWTTFNSKVATTRSISTSSPLSGGGDLSADRTISIQDAAADGSTKGAATFSANDFNSATGLISIDYTNGQAASSSTKGFLTSSDWSTFNGKLGLYFVEAQNTSSPNATIYVDSLTAVSAVTDTDFVIKPKGAGALLGAIPDGAVTGGNKRGNYAVDWQMQRLGAARVASGANSTIVGGYNNEASGQYSVSGGASSQAQGQSSIAFGISAIASGTASIALGSGVTASGNNSIAIGQTLTASFANSIAIGLNSTASGAQNIAIGASANATGSAPCIAIGNGVGSSGQYSVSIGRQSTANASTSVALGSYAHTYGIIGRFAYNSNFITTSGESQKSTLILIKRTTDATPTLLSVDNGAANSSNQLNLQNNNSIRFKGSIIARQSGSTNTAAWDIDGIIQRGANAASTTILVGNVNVVQNTPGWGTPTLTANTTLGGLSVTVTGLISTNIMWVATIDTTEVIYA